MATTILVAGATGNLGGRITRELVKRGANVRALVRASSDPAKIDKLAQQGVAVVNADFGKPDELAKACEGVSCVVSALQGLRDVIVDTQTRLLDAAIAAGVPRFIPSDFSSDFTKLPAGENRNFDLRRAFNERVDGISGDVLQATSILNGAFADLLSYGMPLLNFEKKQIGYWGDADWRIDFTTMDDTAAYTAAVALDNMTPRVLRIASFQISPNELAAVMKEIGTEPFAVVRLGSLDDLAAYNRRERAAHPEGEQELYPVWQQSQYMQSMFSVQNDPLDNDRYPAVRWTDIRDVLAQRAAH
ncbi:aromatic alcohol reductase [Spirosoma sp. KUDC1026]|uniref:aromatic alcohol reductase n=1 Tax=Spirosoma sp. KUDC1026 TaxID=2745947 RepID=UPI00159B94AC|nr:aromatic alcohol reductase [Spirosoma sp. KUDC1026]QKZ13958.1 NmrA family NAD(P)-binding protein [Spirosoma sp. KUDC1026]